LKVPVKLNTQKEIIWGLPASNILLTTQDTDTVFETEALTSIQKQSLYLAVKTQKVFSSVDPDLFFRFPEKSKESVSIDQKPKVITKTPDELAFKAKEALEGNVSEIKKTILSTKDLRLMKMMLVLEEGSKKRATLTKLLSDQIEQIEKKVVSEASKEVPGSPPVVIDPAIEKMPGIPKVDYTVEEEVGETVTIVIDNKVGES